MASRLGKIATKIPSFRAPTLPDTLKGGRLEKIGMYFRNILEDYRVVAVETLQDMKERPLKSSIILSMLGATRYFFKKNPSEADFKEQLIKNSNELLLLGEPIRNPHSDGHIQTINKYLNTDQLRRFTFGVCSIMWVDNFSREVDVYEAHAKPIAVGWLDMHSHVVDIGILGRWLWMERAMTDYDINPYEWEEKPNVDVYTQLPNV